MGLASRSSTKDWDKVGIFSPTMFYIYIKPIQQILTTNEFALTSSMNGEQKKKGDCCSNYF